MKIRFEELLLNSCADYRIEIDTFIPDFIFPVDHRTCPKTVDFQPKPRARVLTGNKTRTRAKCYTNKTNARNVK